MTLAAKLQMRASQSLVMTPQLMQSIRLLQLTHVELERFLDEEIEKNPLLSRAEPAADAAASPPVETPAPDAEADWFDRGENFSAEGMAGRLDASLENLFPDDPGRQDRLGPSLLSSWRSAGSGGAASAGEWDLDDFSARPPSLFEQLNAEIALRFRRAHERLCAEALLDELDESGYCRADLSALAARLGLALADVERVLKACQAFEPAGIFARDLGDCLAIQLSRRDRLDPAMEALLGRLDLLAKRDFSSLSRLCGVGGDDLLDMLAEIRRLDPRPGRELGLGAAEPVVPDVEVRPAPDGGWQVEINPDTLPRVLVDQSYYARVTGKTREPAEKQFMSACLQNANWLARSLDQRARTILKVATEIVKRQDGFLVGGLRFLKPLNLKTVADSIGMHESTVSRVTANKYMLTPRGTFELRFFFSAAIQAADGGESHSALAVQDRIRTMIATEKPENVLSDDAIVVALKENGVDIARRTVAKYREALAIPSSVERRREKRARADAAATR
ncbi:MAG TPA: RNA polymerase factor sigma-54 [Mesorhizobium sp.]|jgi:RNA polymerase sigma-54 factor|nr:RNA polymerase factor sigma-54 [Mesorhizobium sp.]